MKVQAMTSRYQKRDEMISRRELLLASLGLVSLTHRALASDVQSNEIGWDSFLFEMKKLADNMATGKTGHVTIAGNGVKFLQQLDTGSAEFKAAVNEAFETGNQYWLWQRMIKEQNINGGILNIYSEQPVLLHDHPGATGMLRVISGETEVWQFDKIASSIAHDGTTTAELKRVSHQVLMPGDTAVLTPDAGNIHAFRVISKQCSMLDFFIPPYKKSQRSWYQPFDHNWFNSETISCRSIPQHEFAMA